MTFEEFARRYYVKVNVGDINMENFDRDRDIRGLKIKVMERLAMIVQNPYMRYGEIVDNMLSITDYDMLREGELEYSKYQEHRKQQIKENKDKIKEAKYKGRELLAKREEVRKRKDEILEKCQGEKMTEKDKEEINELKKKIKRYTDLMKKQREQIKKIENSDTEEVIKVFDDVTEEDSNLYMYLLDTIESGSKENSMFQCLKSDKWWEVDENIRREILRLINNVFNEKKWLSVRKYINIICYKMIKPYEYYIKSNIEWIAFNCATLDRPKEVISESELRTIVDCVSKLKGETQIFIDKYYKVMEVEDDRYMEEYLFGNSDSMWYKYEENFKY